MSDAEFDWEFKSDSWEEGPEAEGDWAADLPAPKETPAVSRAARPRRSRRRIVLIGLSVLGLIGVLIYVAIAQRINAVVDPIKKDIRSAYELVQSAVEQSDRDLFASLQSDFDIAGWRNMQRMLFEFGHLIERRPLGLALQSTAPVQVDVDFAPGETQAEVLADYAYVTDTGQGVTQTVRLRQATPYRFERQRWLLGPPDGAFWGNRVTVEGSRLALTYAKRDEPVGRRLADDLNRLLEDVCPRLGDMLCPTRFPLRVRLDESLGAFASFIDLASSPAYYNNAARRGSSLNLPSPSLIGVPLDDAGYQALYRVYATQLLKMLMTQQWGRQTTPRTWTYYQTALENELARLGLRSWPAAGVQSGPLPASVVPPSQAVVLYCVKDLTWGGDLLRYTPATGEWQTELSNRNFLSLGVLPNANGIVLQEQSVLTNPAGSRLLLWHNGVEQTLASAETSAPLAVFTGGTDPSGRKLSVVLNASEMAALGAPQYQLLDLDSCQLLGCALDTLPGFPLWSPDGAWLLTQDQERWTLFRNQPEGRFVGAIEEGQSLFWLDDQTFGYIRLEITPGLQARFEVRVSPVESAGGSQVLLNSETVATYLAGELQADQLSLDWVKVNPANADQLLIAASSSGAPTASFISRIRVEYHRYFLLFDRRSGELSLAFKVNGFSANAEFSPDGRWLVAGVSEPGDGAQPLQFLNLGQGQIEAVALPATDPNATVFTQRNWSADGQWFLMPRDGVLHLITPGQAYHQTVVPQAPGCLFADWVDSQ